MKHCVLTPLFDSSHRLLLFEFSERLANFRVTIVCRHVAVPCAPLWLTCHLSVCRCFLLLYTLLRRTGVPQWFVTCKHRMFYIFCMSESRLVHILYHLFITLYITCSSHSTYCRMLLSSLSLRCWFPFLLVHASFARCRVPRGVLVFLTMRWFMICIDLYLWPQTFKLSNFKLSNIKLSNFRLQDLCPSVLGMTHKDHNFQESQLSALLSLQRRHSFKYTQSSTTFVPPLQATTARL